MTYIPWQNQSKCPFSPLNTHQSHKAYCLDVTAVQHWARLDNKLLIMQFDTRDLVTLNQNHGHQIWYGSSPWYNRNGWLGVKHQVTYWCGSADSKRGYNHAKLNCVQAKAIETFTKTKYTNYLHCICAKNKKQNTKIKWWSIVMT